jgi:signal transduction histidine kinase
MLRGALWRALQAARSWHARDALRRIGLALGNIPVVPGARLRFFVHFLHELRTPIALVDGPLQELARMPGLDPPARDLVAVARQNCLRLHRIAEDFLALVRTGHEHPRAAPAPIELDEWLRGLCAAARHHPGLGRASVTEELSAPGSFVCADRIALERIFLNLLSNAVKFSGGRGEIRIGSERRSGRAAFYVQDRGIGIDPRRHGAIFRRFRQADPSIALRFGGFGLGLALARELARREGARIEVKSRPGEGARFTVALLAVPAPARDARMPLRSAPAPDEGPDPFDFQLRSPIVPPREGAADGGRASRPRVLVVEDEPEMRWLVGTALCAEFDLAFASSAEEGWRAALHRAPEVLLTDWRLPGADGLWLAARLRALPDPPRVVLITAHLQEPERNAALGCGIDDFLQKPFSLAELAARLRNLARAHGTERMLRAANAGLARANAELAAVRAALIQEEKLKSIGLLAAGLIHEIQNPLAYMRNALALLAEEFPVARPGGAPAQADAGAGLAAAGPGGGELVRACDEGLARVTAIVNDLRVFSHRRDAASPGSAPGAGSGPLPLLWLGGAARSALRLCRSRLEGVGVQARLDDARVPGDEGQIVQVFVNLLVNAADAARAGGRPAQIDIEVQALPGLARARVRDHGPGFPARILPRLFEPFCTTRAKGEGMGLGLAICRAIVTAHEGAIRAGNCADGGAFVEFSLPNAPRPAAGATQAPEEPA